MSGLERDRFEPSGGIDLMGLAGGGEGILFEASEGLDLDFSFKDLDFIELVVGREDAEFGA